MPVLGICLGIYNAINIDLNGETLIAEVQQHNGNNWVRALALDSTDGLARGAKVVDTGQPITVPVGPETLGRIFNVVGEPIDPSDFRTFANLQTSV